MTKKDKTLTLNPATIGRIYGEKMFHYSLRLTKEQREWKEEHAICQYLTIIVCSSNYNPRTIPLQQQHESQNTLGIVHKCRRHGLRGGYQELCDDSKKALILKIVQTVQTRMRTLA